MMTGVPRLSVDEAAALANSLFGLQGTVHELPSERDQNFLLRAADDRNWVLKIANTNETRAMLEAENGALEHVSALDLCPQLRRTRDGRDIGEYQSHRVRCVSGLRGSPLGATARQSSALRNDLGRALGRLDGSLLSFDHAALHRTFHWDLAHALPIIEERLPLVADSALQAQIRDAAEYHRNNIQPKLADFRHSVIHGDANDFNWLVDAQSQRVTGLVDFGDMVFSHTVNDVAVAMAYVALNADDPLAAAADVVAGFHEALPLTEVEIAALFSLMRLRLCVSVCVAATQRAARPDVPYLSISQGPIGVTLPRLAAIHPRFAHYTFRHACGLPAVPHAPRVVQWLTSHTSTFAPLIGHDLGSAPVAPIDLSVGSALLSGDSAENTAAKVDARVQRVLQEHQATIGVGGYDEPRVMYEWQGEDDALERRTIHMGLDISMVAGSPLFAPLDGVVHGFEDANRHHDYGPVIVLRHTTTGEHPTEFYTLYGHLTRDSLHGLRVGEAIGRGQEFARIGSAPTNGNWWAHVHVQVVTDMLDVPCNVDGAARVSQRDVWRSLCPDPNLLLGIPASSLPTHQTLASVAAAREQHFGRNLSVSYGSSPLHMVRGWKQYLYDDVGTRYIDAYNNVAHVGHAHPRVVRAVSEQWGTLNTNTRYLQSQLVEYAHSLCALLPSPLEVCYFTASGSEANELALRLARTYTNRKDVIVMDAAYHGHTNTLIDISPYKHAGPGGSGAPDWVHVVPIPDVYRYREVQGDAGAWFAEYVAAAIAGMATTGRGMSAFIAETCPSVGGQIMLPPGYLGRVYAAVRAAGGLCIADEVQTGFGRIGTHFWAFEQQQVIPDIVVLGKPIANGYPMGAVITTRAIADGFANGMEFFSTFGGSTAACAAARATLDVVRGEGLQHNALQVGERLLAEFRTLMPQCELIGDVRGSGLFLGVELVQNRETREPAADQAREVVNGMRQRGVLAGTDGPHHNVIKVRGPMTLSMSDADRIVDAMRQSLREWT